MSRKETKDSSGRFAYDGLDRVLHEKARLGMLTSMALRPDGVLFTELKEMCELTDGNLSRHLTVLQEAGMVEIWKGFKGRRPQTLVRLTDDGRKRFLSYISVLDAVVQDASQAKAVRRGSKAAPEGFSPA